MEAGVTARLQGIVGRALLALATMLALASPALAADTQVAVAANFTEPAREIAAAFKRATGHNAVLSFGSSGQFYAQMAQGAPYEVFLSADSERPATAEQAGLGVPGTRFTYAVGRLALYSKTPGLVDGRGAVLGGGKVSKVAIADPALAPYGVAAVETMKKLGVYDRVRPKLVTGSSITQAYQFVETGAAEVGFVAYSQVVRQASGSRWLVPGADHAPIEQQAILLKRGQESAAAKAFLAFLKSPAAVAIIKRYGYDVR
jgi:molybdate transport system substrate-binding protein